MLNAHINHFLLALLLIPWLTTPSHLAIGQVEQLPKSRAEMNDLLPANEMFGGLRWPSLVKNIEDYRESRRIWFTKDRLTPQGDSMVAIIRDLRYYGLIPK